MVLLFTAGIAFWMSVLHRYQTQVSETMMMVFADLAVALAASLSARFTFYDRNWFVRFLAALVALLIGLFSLGVLTNWDMGIGSINAWRRQVEWIEVIQLAGSLIVLLVALRAWWRPPVQVDEFEDEPEPARAAVRRTRRSQSHEPKLPRFHLPTSWTSGSSRNGRLKVRKSRSNARAAASEPDRVVVSRPIKPARSRRRKARKPELQLSVYEEHRCPYCLEEVKRNDPRGVKQCDICHTLHHADCWNVTGMCQIPHLNALNL
jgi:hypothetical protein